MFLCLTVLVFQSQPLIIILINNIMLFYNKKFKKKIMNFNLAMLYFKRLKTQA